MFTEKDKSQITNRGSQLDTVNLQIENFKKGFPFLHIEDAASVGNGIIRLNEDELKRRIDLYNIQVEQNIKPLKFIPASGAASRMFKSLFEGLESFEKNIPEKEILAENKAVKEFADKLDNFAFATDLKNIIQKNSDEINCKN